MSRRWLLLTLVQQPDAFAETPDRSISRGTRIGRIPIRDDRIRKFCSTRRRDFDIALRAHTVTDRTI